MQREVRLHRKVTARNGTIALMTRAPEATAPRKRRTTILALQKLFLANMILISISGSMTLRCLHRNLLPPVLMGTR